MKNKYDRRRAIKCEILKKSSSHKDYCKYKITICELDGTVHSEVAYGKDMQDALSRLINTERTVKVEKKIESNVLWILLIWAAIMGWPTLITDGGSPMYILYMFISVITMFGLAGLWYNYINKK
tara:strand:+ start:849 stop:1220 length:372 start_codon:yes stop_codon:yes gene_type:complete